MKQSLEAQTFVFSEFRNAAAREAGARVGFVMMATILGMALGGWMSGWIYDVSGSYEWAFLNGIAWNFLNLGIMIMILMRARRGGMPSAPVSV